VPNDRAPSPRAPIVRLALVRLWHRRGRTLATATAVASAVVLVLALSAIVTVTTDQALRERLAALTPGERAVAITRYDESGRSTTRAADAVERALDALGAVAADPTSGAIFRQVGVEDRPFELQLVALDDPTPHLDLASGHEPAPCDGRSMCEAVLLSRVPAPELDGRPWRIGGLDVTVVGRATLVDDRPLGALDLRGPGPAAPDSYLLQPVQPTAILLVRGTDAVLTTPALESVGRTRIRTAVLDPEAARAWRLDDLHGAVDEANGRLAGTGASLRTPLPALDEERARAAAGSARLAIVGSLAVAVLLAFSLFAGLVTRTEVAEELARLARSGATRGQRRLLVPAEAVVTAGVGGVLGLGAGLLAAILVALSAGAPPVDVVGAAVAAPAPLAIGAAVLIAAAVVIAIGASPVVGTRRLAGLTVVVTLVAAVVLGWQAATSGPDAAGGPSGPVTGPVLTVLPAAAAFLLALGLLAIVPPVLRLAAHRIRRVPLSARLALLSTARTPDQHGAAAVLLALGVAALAFSASYVATLDRSIEEGAAWATGMDGRIVEGPTTLTATPTVLPLDRYASLGPGVVTTPVMRFSAEGGGGRVALLGLPAGALPELRAWRTDMASAAPADLATAIALPGDWSMAGQPLPPGERDLTLRFEHDGDRMRLAAFVATPGGQVVRVALGSVSSRDRERSARLPDAAVGGTLVGLEYGADELVAGEYHPGGLRRATVTYAGLDGLTGGETAEVQISGNETFLVRAPQRSDGMALPAVVSPALAGRAGDDGILTIETGAAVLDLRVAGVASSFPTIADPAAQVAIVDLAPLRLALGSAMPTAAHPNEAWLRVDDPAALPRVRAALAEAPFRVAESAWRDQIAAARTADPVARAAASGLFAAAGVAVLLAIAGIVVGVAGDVADRRGEFAELERQGVRPRVLGRVLVGRTMGVAVAGALAGLVAGALLAAFAPALTSLAADARAAVPPLVPVVPLLPLAAVVAAVLLLATAVMWLVARAAFGGATIGERRSAGAAAATARSGAARATEGDRA
jgi:hypothetical protein